MGPVRTTNTWPPALSKRTEKQEDTEHQIATLAFYTVYTCYFYIGSQAEPAFSLYLDSRSLDKPERLLYASGHSGVQGERLLRQIITFFLTTSRSSFKSPLIQGLINLWTPTPTLTPNTPRPS